MYYSDMSVCANLEISMFDRYFRRLNRSGSVHPESIMNWVRCAVGIGYEPRDSGQLGANVHVLALEPIGAPACFIASLVNPKLRRAGALTSASLDAVTSTRNMQLRDGDPVTGQG